MNWIGSLKHLHYKSKRWLQILKIIMYELWKCVPDQLGLVLILGWHTTPPLGSSGTLISILWLVHINTRLQNIRAASMDESWVHKENKKESVGKKDMGTKVVLYYMLANVAPSDHKYTWYVILLDLSRRKVIILWYSMF